VVGNTEYDKKGEGFEEVQGLVEVKGFVGSEGLNNT
jgi:hypothetical protein